MYVCSTNSGFVITPIVSFANALTDSFTDASDNAYSNEKKTALSQSTLSRRLKYTIDKNEVEDVFLVPLAHFLHEDNFHSVTVILHNQSHQVHFIPYKHYNIWGATAAMLKDLAAHLT